MRKLLIIITTALILFLFSNKSAYAELDEIRIDISHDTYAKEQFWYGYPYFSPSIYLGWDPTPTHHMRTRPYLKYSLASLNSLGINADQIESIKLMLFNWRPIHSGPFEIELFAITGEWIQEKLDWNNQPALHQPSVFAFLQGSLLLESIDVTDLVLAQYTGVIPNNGIMFKKVDEYEPGAFFWSLECEGLDYGDPCTYANKPHLLIKLKPTPIAPPPAILQTPLNHANINANSLNLTWISDLELSTEDQVEISLSPLFENITYASEWGEINEFALNNLSPATYYWRVNRRLLTNPALATYSEVWEFTIPQSTLPPQEDETLPPPLNTPPKSDSKAPVDIALSKNIPAPKTEVTIQIPTPEASTAILLKELAQKESCKFKYNLTTKSGSLIKCDAVKPKLLEISHSIAGNNLYWITVTAQYLAKVKMIIELVSCKPFSIIDPSSWYGCTEVSLQTLQKEVDIQTIFKALVDKQQLVQYLSTNKSSYFEIIFSSGKNITNKELKLYAFSSFSVKVNSNQWWDYAFTTASSNKLKIPPFVSPTKKPFQFMLKGSIGVTQWHGYTAFQSPHTGIDFGVANQPIFAIEEGTVEFAGWDDYYGKCLSGGNVLRIKHKNGMHSVYMHLKNFITNGGTKLTAGMSVTKGQLIGTTGNTGAYNCQPLASHLHMELRQTKNQATHKDPVNYLETDWNKILTLGAAQFPGRLTGDNPHPGK